MTKISRAKGRTPPRRILREALIGEAEALARVLIAARRAEVADFAGLTPVEPEDMP